MCVSARSTAEASRRSTAPHGQDGSEDMALLVRTPLDPAAVAPSIRASARVSTPACRCRGRPYARRGAERSRRQRALPHGGPRRLRAAGAQPGRDRRLWRDRLRRGAALTRDRDPDGPRRAPRRDPRLVVGEGMLTVAVGYRGGTGGRDGPQPLHRLSAVRDRAQRSLDARRHRALIAAVALAACLVPARRAMRVDPAWTLRGPNDR